MPEPLILHRAANQAARAVIAVIEEQTGEEVSLYDAMRLVNVIGASLERNGLEGGPSGTIRAILEQPYDASKQRPKDADGQSLEVGQELFDSYHRPVRVLSFTPEGVEVEPTDKSEPSEVVEANSLSRERVR